LALAAAIVMAAMPLTGARADDAAPVAGAFVYPVGDELDYSKPRAGELSGFYVSSEYLDTRGKKRKRIHRGVDLSNGRGGAEVRSVASGVVVVADANAKIKVKRRQTVKVPVVVDGKTTTKSVTKVRATWKWRTGWGNYVVVRHTLPGGEAIYSLYGHLAPQSVKVKKGDLVSAGEPLGKVGRTGRASSSHLHFEVRKSMPATGEDENLDESDEPPAPEEKQFVKLATLDPLPFLNEHVFRFGDLEPGSWQARYASAATRDGILAGDRNRFEPDDAITRADFYGALVTAFRLAAPFTKQSFSASVDALVDLGILDRETGTKQRAGDNVQRADALELMLRCLDRAKASGRALSSIKPDAVATDFIRQFAGDDVAGRALEAAKAKAVAEFELQKKTAAQERARLAKVAKKKGKKPRGVPAPKLGPALPELDPGLEALAQSKKKLTRAESCLLLASATRLAAGRASPLERAISRVPQSG
jgi:murein DD-endopeptidase MepM/ murein hydrolase activator NlpD